MTNHDHDLALTIPCPICSSEEGVRCTIQRAGMVSPRSIPHATRVTQAIAQRAQGTQKEEDGLTLARELLKGQASLAELRALAKVIVQKAEGQT